MADTLRGVARDVASGLDFSTLERLPASFVTEHLGQRHADMLWRIQTRELLAPVPEGLVGYLPRHRYLLIELQALDPSLLPPENVLSMIAGRRKER